MVAFRRNRVAGGTYFFTVTLRDRHLRMLVDQVDLLRKAFRDVRRDRRFTIDAIVILPEHLHAVLTLPDGDADYSGRWRAIKGAFSRSLVHAGVNLAKDRRGEYRLWQRRFWEHTIRDQADLQAHVDYPKGDPENPATKTEVIAKFHALTEKHLDKKKREKIINTMSRLDELKNVAELADLIR